MLGVVHIRAVDQIEILIGGAAAHVQGGGEILQRQDAWQGPPRAQQVCFGQLRNGPDLLGCEPDFGHRFLEEAINGPHRISTDDDALGYEMEIQHQVLGPVDDDLEGRALVANVDAYQCVPAGIYIEQDVAPAEVGDRTDLMITQEDGSADEGFVILGIVDEPARARLFDAGGMKGI